MNKAEIVARLDEIEAELFSQTNRVKRLRLDIQREWNVLPSHRKVPDPGLDQVGAARGDGTTP